MMIVRGFVLALVVLLTGLPAAAQPLRLILPTRNDALLRGDGPAFYQFTDRNYKGRRSTPWEGGGYGFVRNLKDTPAGAVFTRFHEGLDIKPVYRDRDGEPLDTVRVVDSGKVVYVNFEPKESNYGKYVVVEHWWSGSPFYSLYAHLGSAHVHRGQRLRQGDPIGIMGYTGRGIDRRRAHVHFEINMLLNQAFDDWHSANFKRSENNHGAYNGLNLAGIDVAALYLALQQDPTLTIRGFIARQEPFFSILVPNSHLSDLQYRYPWLAGHEFDANAPSFEMAFTQSGLPVRLASSYRPAPEPFVAYARSSDASYALVTSHVSGTAAAPTLSSSGKRYIDLLMTPTDDTRRGTLPTYADEETPAAAQRSASPPPAPRTPPQPAVQRQSVAPAVSVSAADHPAEEEYDDEEQVQGW